MKKYNIIYADPPWSYRDKCVSGKRGAEYKYPCANLDDLKKIPVTELADANAVLVMWVTWPMLPDALSLIDAWGFTYKTCGFVWLKRNKRYWDKTALMMRKVFRKSEKASDITTEKVKTIMQESEFFVGMGAAGTRANTEFCLIAKRGKMSRINAGIRQIVDEPISIIEPKLRHSEKPAIIRSHIVELFGDDIPRIELFARQQALGWDAWGNENNISYIDIQKYEMPEQKAS